MSLLTAHKILISSAILMFALYGAAELRNYNHGDAAALVRSLVAAAAAVGLGVYLRRVWRRNRRPA